ncbi:noncanonical pyrimidine nucleotidase, YjjG family [Lactiplantibacillus garii]|uniref:Noncanonical pyrimidine nucleotidase, YjjG family n=1 Tax=Lactiplantibacillus garii TaxID=2306423 RepID=A0A3R8QSR9_9LACO|nr:YjjG family noncanonical pyrimidine nucleotidase [Lactiplantibacillus garii]RRK11333.1 noncanonical pyrimidine nucleotidase, YjjG family [Lactiplantibacillus garii]
MKAVVQVLKYVIFDLDDTLLDFQAAEQSSLKTILTRYHVPDLTVAKRCYLAHNHQVWAQIEHGGDREQLLNQRFQIVLGKLGIVVDGPTVQREYNALLGQGYQTLPGVQSLLTTLKTAQLTLLIGTNGVQDTQLNRIRGAGLAPYFDHVFISEAVGVAKPDRRFFDAMTTRYPDLTPDNAVMVGDSLASDITGAANAGLASIWFNPHHQVARNVRPTVTVTDFSQLQHCLLNW